MDNLRVSFFPLTIDLRPSSRDGGGGKRARVSESECAVALGAWNCSASFLMGGDGGAERRGAERGFLAACLLSTLAPFEFHSVLIYYLSICDLHL